MRNLFIVILLAYCSCNSNDKTATTTTTGKDTDYNFGPIKDTIPVNPAINDADLDVFGDIRLGQAYTETIRLLGEPASKSKPVEWGADGLMHEDWDYKAKGMVINMNSDKANADKTRVIFSITAKAPCTFRTTRNIGIGSSYAEVTNAYKGSIDPSATDATIITVGSVYDGIIFNFKNDKVETIFLGAAAE